MIKPESALVVIDVQVALVKGAYAEAAVLGAIDAAITKFRECGGLVVFVQHCHATYEPMMKGQPGWNIHPNLSQSKADVVIDKTASDGFYKTPLDDCLREHDIENVYVCGLQTEFCVDTTCRAALSHGYTVTLISDAHTTGDSHMSAAEIIKHHNTILATLAHPNGSVQLQLSNEL